MKNCILRVTVSCLFLLLAFRASAQLSVAFDTYYDDKPVRGYSYVLYADGDKMDSTAVKTNKSGAIKLDTGKVYLLRIIKSGYVDKLIMVDTHVSNQLNPETIPAFEFDIKLSTWAGKVNNEFRDFPSALLYINSSKKEFVLSKPYSNFWNSNNQ